MIYQFERIHGLLSNMKTLPENNMKIVIFLLKDEYKDPEEEAEREERS